MDIEMVTGFFMWCTVVNLGLFVLSAVMCVYAADFIFRVHGKMFSISRESFNVVMYSFLGFYKIMFIVFNLVPFIALKILG